jgi:predicted RNase H-like HicB family nuclease
MSSTTYVGMICKDEDSCFGVVFPDFQGCVSAGDTREEAETNAREALILHIECMVANGQAIQGPSAIHDLNKHKANLPGFMHWFLADVPEQAFNPSVRISPPSEPTVMPDNLPAGLYPASNSANVVEAINAPPDTSSVTIRPSTDAPTESVFEIVGCTPETPGVSSGKVCGACDGDGLLGVDTPDGEVAVWCDSCNGTGGTDPEAVSKARQFSADYKAELFCDESDNPFADARKLMGETIQDSDGLAQTYVANVAMLLCDRWGVHGREDRVKAGCEVLNLLFDIKLTPEFVFGEEKVECGDSCDICAGEEEALEDMYGPEPTTRVSGHLVDGFVRELGATVRDCLDCGCLIAGGPTRCKRCAKEKS